MEAGGSQITKRRIHNELNNMGTKQPQIDRARILGNGTNQPQIDRTRILGYRQYYRNTRLGENITREHNDKAASGEYRIPKPPNKPGGYGNLGVSAALILVAAISKRLAAGQSSVTKEKDTTQFSR